MEIRYDAQADAMYISFRKGEFFSNRKIDDLTIADLDEQGNLLGIELLQVSQRFPEESLQNVTLFGISAA